MYALDMVERCKHAYSEDVAAYNGTETATATLFKLYAFWLASLVSLRCDSRTLTTSRTLFIKGQAGEEFIGRLQKLVGTRESFREDAAAHDVWEARPGWRVCICVVARGMGMYVCMCTLCLEKEGGKEWWDGGKRIRIGEFPVDDVFFYF